MAERDAFGREVEDDPIAAMGWSTAQTSAQTTATEAERSPLQRLPGDTGEPRRRRGRRSSPRLVRALVVTLFVAALLVFVAALAVPPVIDAIEELDDVSLVDDDPVADPSRSDAPSAPAAPDTPDEPEEARAPAKPPTGLGRRSLLLRGNLAPALRDLRELAPRSRVRSVRIAADRINVQTLGGGRLRNLMYTWDEGADQLSSVAMATMPTGFTYTWSQVNTSAPRRIVRRATRGRAASSFDYMVLFSAASLRWSAFRKDGTGFSATADGRSVQRIGG